MLCILVEKYIDQKKTVYTEAMYSQGHQTGFIHRINCMRIRQGISKHISIAYNMLH